MENLWEKASGASKSELSVDSATLSDAVCASCAFNLNNLCAMDCVHCPTFTVCLKCFLSGSVLKSDHKGHEFKPRLTFSQPIFSKDWTAKEELLLLHGIRNHGLGSWGEIAKTFSGSKSAIEIRDHYYNDYLGRYGHILPATELTQSSLDNEFHVSKVDDASSMYMKSHPQLGNPVPVELVSLGPGTDHTSILGKRSISQANDLQENEPESISAAGNPLNFNASDFEALGYSFKRDEFDIEPDNDLEKMLEFMDFSPSDTPEDAELKNKVLKIYNRRLEAREKRHNFAVRWGLLNAAAVNLDDKKFSNQETKDLASRMMAYSRFHAPDEFHALLKKISDVKDIRSRIEMLQSMRKTGITTSEEGKKFEDNISSSYRESLSSKKPRLEDENGDIGKNNVVGQKTIEENKVLKMRLISRSDIITDKEMKFCRAVRLTPQEYMKLKKFIIHNCVSKGVVSSATISKQVLCCSAKQAEAVLCFMTTLGIVKAS